MSTSNKKNIVRGKRYTSEEKNKVVTFIAEYNEKNGRGGQSVAAKKFKISQLTIANWLKKAGIQSSVKGSGPKGNIQKKLSAMLVLGEEIEKLDRELKAKRTQFDSLKASL